MYRISNSTKSTKSLSYTCNSCRSLSQIPVELSLGLNLEKNKVHVSHSQNELALLYLETQNLHSNVEIATLFEFQFHV